MSPLQIAVEKENFEIVRLILNNPKLDINLLCERSQNIRKTEETALHIAVEKENIEILTLLLSNQKIDVNYSCKMDKGHPSSDNYECAKKTALHIAIEIKNIEIVKLLLQNDKININSPFILLNKNSGCGFYSSDKHESKRYETAFHLAIKSQNIDIIQLFLSNEKIDVNYPIRFQSSSEYENPDWKYKSNIEEEIPPLYNAVNDGNIDVVRILLQNERIDVNNPLIHRMNILSGKEYKYKEMTPLHIAVKNKKTEIVSLLLKSQKIDVNIPIKSSENESESEKSALHLAVISGKIEIIKMLLQNKNINTNSEDHLSKKAIDYANSTEIKQLFDDRIISEYIT